MKLKHSKYRNTGILFELLVRQITADTLKGGESPALPLLKKYFSQSQLGREYKLYETLMKSDIISEGKANILISTVLESSSKINRTQLKREKYNLIKEINESYDGSTFFSSKLPTYKRLASVYTLMEAYNTNDQIDTDQLVDNKVTLLEYLTKEEVKAKEVESDILKEFKKQSPEMRSLAYRILLEKFNEKYSELSIDQKRVLKEFIESENSGVKLREFYNSKINELRDILKEEISKVDNDVIKIKLDEVKKYLVEIKKTDKVSNDNIVDLLEYFELVKEIKNSHGN
jgi:hypothetical protein|tara:strand:- start:1607 stop:2467 length:861 start_codon:yes stop_codon:yes gene_type:complete